jgi:hypothetical protein
VEWLFLDALALLEVLDKDPDCHHISRDWCLRPGLVNADDEPWLPVPGLPLHGGPTAGWTATSNTSSGDSW